MIVHAPAPAAAAPIVLVEAAPVVDQDAIELEGSRLRAQLRIFDDGERALVGGDPERAVARALHLRQRYVNGALDLDAAILSVRALRAAGRIDEARAALDELRAHPLAKEKRAVLEELHGLLPKPIEAEAPPRVLPVPRRLEADDDHDAPARPRAPKSAPAAAAEAQDATARDEENMPSRVIGVVTP